jgi:hypothetical protein
MKVFKNTSPAARTSLIYITLGALGVIWCIVGFVYFQNYPPQSPIYWYLGAGALGTSIMLLLIGLAIGKIGQVAKPADQNAADQPAALPPQTQPQPQMMVPVAPVAPPPQPMANVPVAPVANTPPR